MFCEKCGQKINDDAVFCPYCGADVSKSKPTEGGYSEEHTHKNSDEKQKVNIKAQSKSKSKMPIILLSIIGICIIAIIAVILIFVAGNGETNEKATDQDGSYVLIEEITHYTDTNSNYRTEYFYNADGSFSSKQYDTNTNTLSARIEFNKYGKVTYSASFDSSGEATSGQEGSNFDKYGNPLNVTFWSSGVLSYYSKTSFKYKYDSNGNILVETAYDEDGNFSYETINEYDEYNNVIHMKYDTGSSIIEARYVFKYDEYGKALEREVHSEGIITHKSIYEYDENGNLIKETFYNRNGNIQSTTEYKYNFIPN